MKILKLIFFVFIIIVGILFANCFTKRTVLDKSHNSGLKDKTITTKTSGGYGISMGKFPNGFDGAKWGMTITEVMEIIQKEGKEIDTSQHWPWTISKYCDKKAVDQVLEREAAIYYNFSNETD